MYYQQGDVLLKKIEMLPDDLTEIYLNEDKILAKGEITNHAHRIKSDNKVRLLRDVNGNLYLDVQKESILLHEEHGDIIISPAKYRIEIVQEYNHFLEETRKIVD